MAGSPHVRFPLIGEDVSEFYGTVYTPKVLGRLQNDGGEPIDFRELSTEPMTVSSDVVVSDLIDRFQAENQELALVVDEIDEVVGLVTATDAFEQITGDLEDPMDVVDD